MASKRIVLFIVILFAACGNSWWRRRHRRCPTNPCKWKWGSCSKTCGGGIRYPVKTQNQGQCGSCNMPKAKPCNTNCCPVNCKWGSWNSWSTCSEKCGGGTQVRSRRYSGPSCGGAACSGPAVETRACNEQCCAVNCSWAAWGEWEGCSKSCGGGINVRHRGFASVAQCGGQPCNGSVHDEKPCNSQCCPTDCAWQNWQQWSSCSALCGGGTQQRKRGQNPVSSCGGSLCVGESVDERPCNENCCPQNCVWGEWGNWTSCTKTCDGGYQYRERQVAVAALCGGKECIGQNEEIEICNEQCCPVDCAWNDWGDWGECTKTCNKGMQSRERSVNVFALCAGQDCDGTTSETRSCNDFCCPSQCEYHPWGEWSMCSKSCGNGTQTRSRKVEMGSSCIAEKCQGEKTEIRDCSTNCCPVNCALSEWTKWSDCTYTCGSNGLQSRSKQIIQQASCGGLECNIQESLIQARQCNRVCFNGGLMSVLDGCACIDSWTGDCCQLDINECDFVTCPENSKCLNTAGSFECVCNHNFTKHGGLCDSYDECSVRGQKCHEQAECMGEEGNYACKCLPGFEGDGTMCKDVDECELEEIQATIEEHNAFKLDIYMSGSGGGKSPLCHTEATCINTYGSYKCQCNQGYTGDGLTCSDIDECSLMNNEMQQYNYGLQEDDKQDIMYTVESSTIIACSYYANCTNVPGGYNCWCKPGFYGDGFTCEGME
uniref:fibrillin-3-like n=1 Tax=Styela clava TaxID=7725 RepID=UPI00193AD920|nr:fibrillin-3-like [Styela clava]